MEDVRKRSDLDGIEELRRRLEVRRAHGDGRAGNGRDGIEEPGQRLEARGTYGASRSPAGGNSPEDIAELRRRMEARKAGNSPEEVAELRQRMETRKARAAAAQAVQAARQKRRAARTRRLRRSVVAASLAAVLCLGASGVLLPGAVDAFVNLTRSQQLAVLAGATGVVPDQAPVEAQPDAAGPEAREPGRAGRPVVVMYAEPAGPPGPDSQDLVRLGGPGTGEAGEPVRDDLPGIQELSIRDILGPDAPGVEAPDEPAAPVVQEPVAQEPIVQEADVQEPDAQESSLQEQVVQEPVWIAVPGVQGGVWIAVPGVQELVWIALPGDQETVWIAVSVIQGTDGPAEPPVPDGWQSTVQTVPAGPDGQLLVVLAVPAAQGDIGYAGPQRLSFHPRHGLGVVTGMEGNDPATERQPARWEPVIWTAAGRGPAPEGCGGLAIKAIRSR